MNQRIKKKINYKKDFFFIRKKIVPSFYFDPSECASYYKSDLGAYVKQRMCEEIDSILQTSTLCKELTNFILSLPMKRIVLLGFGYTVPFMETLLRNFYSFIESYNQKNPFSSITFSSISLIPPSTDSPQKKDGAFQARKMSSPLPPKTQLISVQETEWPFHDHSMPFLFISHGFEGMHNPEDILKEAQRILMPQGELFIIIPHAWTFWLSSPMCLFNKQRVYEVKEMKNMLKEHNFKFKGFEPFASYPPWWNSKQPFRTRTGEITKRQILERFLDFSTKSLFPLFGGLLLIRAKSKFSG